VLAALSASVGYSQATRTWISGVGDDANPCSRTAPCKTFAGAISKTAPGGEIDALDPGGFGALTINKSITIDGGGGQVASILVAGTNGIVVAAQPTDVVVIQNVRFQGLLGAGNSNAGLNGIRFISGGQLHIVNCTITGFGQNGISIAVNQSGAAHVSVVNTVATNNGTPNPAAGNGAGLTIQGNTSSEVYVSVSNSHFNGNQFGIQTLDSSRTAVFESEASGNALAGFVSQPTTVNSYLYIGNSLAANNGQFGIESNGGHASVHVANNDVFNNGLVGLHAVNGGTLVTFGNNNNGDGGATTGTTLPQ